MIISKYELELLGRAVNFAKDAWFVSKPDVDPFDFEGAYPVNATTEERETLDKDFMYILEDLEAKLLKLYDATRRGDYIEL